MLRLVKGVLPPPLALWLHKVARDYKAVRSDAVWLPDYQGS